MKKVLTLFLFLIPNFVLAQEDSRKYFYTRQECEPLGKIMQDIVNRWGETPLFTGEGLTFDYEGTPFTGGSMFMVNQDTGSWTLLTLYGDGTACVSAVGTQFEPYTD